MKKQSVKWAVIILIALTLTSCYKKTSDKKDELPLISEDSVYSSNLPVLYINTDDGSDIVSKEDTKPVLWSFKAMMMPILLCTAVKLR